MKKYFLPNALLIVVGLFAGVFQFANAATVPVLDPTYVNAAYTTQDSSNLSAKVISSGGTSLSFQFQYGTTPSYGSTTPATGGLVGFTGTFTILAYGLTCHQSYYFRAKVTNLAGTAYGPMGTFTTNNCGTATLPSVTTLTTLSVTTTSASLLGQVNSVGGAATFGKMEYGLTTAYGTTIPSTLPTGGTGFPPAPNGYGASATSLTCGTTYHYRAKANNVIGTVYGSDRTFTTLPCSPVVPIVETDAVGAVTTTTAMINGKVTGLGGAPSVTAHNFTVSGGTISAMTPASSIAITTVPTAFSATLIGLTCGTSYTYRATATNSAGTVNAPTSVTFTTLPCPPPSPTPWLVYTDPASAVGPMSATFNGNLSTVGSIPLATVGFNYKLGTVTTTTTADPYVSTPYSASTFGINVTGLACMSTYHFRAWVQDTSGTRYYATTAPYDDLTVTTGSCAMPPVVAMQSIGATIVGKLLSLGITPTGTVPTSLTTNVGFTIDGVAVSAGTQLTAGSLFSVPNTMACGVTHSVYATGNNTNGVATPAGPMPYASAPCVLVPPTVNTLSATVSGTTVTLHGHLVSYGVGPGSVPATSANVAFNFGGTTVASTTSPLSSLVDFSSAPFTVTCGTGTYSYFATATSTGGTGNGTTVTFAKPSCAPAPTPPVVVTDSATSITATSALLNGHVTDMGVAATTVYTDFQYIDDASYVPGAGYSTLTPGSGWISPLPAVPYYFAETITGLTPCTWYDFEAEAANTGFIRDGLNTKFQTLCPSAVPPTVTTVSGSATSTTTATFNGSLDTVGTLPSGASAGSTTLSFEYGTVSGGPYTSTIAGVPSTASSAPTAFSANATGLTSCTHYYFKAKATNSAGTAYGIEKSISLECTSVPPVVQTIDPTTSITATSAVIHGNLVSMGTGSTGGPGGTATLGFNYGTVAGGTYTTSVPAVSISPMTLSAPGSFTGTLTGLTCGTAYKFYAFANNDTGYGQGVLSAVFTTLACPPTVTTNTATGVVISGASWSGVLGGTLTSFGLGATYANLGFRFGPTTAYGSTTTTTSPANPVSASTPVPLTFSASVSASTLASPAPTCNTPWHFQAFATNDSGSTVYGLDKSFCQ